MCVDDLSLIELEGIHAHSFNGIHLEGVAQGLGYKVQGSHKLSTSFFKQ